MHCTVFRSVVLLVGIRTSWAASVVTVSLFGESGCPDTTGFIFGPLLQVEEAVGEILRVNWTPFGNAYYITKECGGVPAPAGCSTSSTCRYDSTVRDCYFQHCGLGGHPRLADCYGPGVVHCQHGAAECFANRVEACVKVRDPAGSWPIAQCIEKAFYDGTLRNGHSSNEEVTKVAQSCGAPEEALSCATGPAGDAAVEQMAKETPPHPGVPYILVNGVVLENEKQLLQAVCKAYQGPKPAGCSGTPLASLASVRTAVRA